MTIYKGTLQGRRTGYAGHSVELSFEGQQAAPAGAAPALPRPFVTRALTNDAGDFVLEVPDDAKPAGPVRLAVYDPAGALLTEETRAALPPPNRSLRIKVLPAEPFEIGEHPDPFIAAPTLFTGHLIERSGRPTVGGRQVILFGRRKLDDDGDPIETVLGLARTADNGYFSLPYLRHFLLAARLEVAGNVDAAAGAIELDGEGRLPSQVRVVVDIPAEDGEAAGNDGVPRAPEPEDLTQASEVFKTDLGGGHCVRLNHPNRTLEEYQYFTILRTTDPFILGQRPQVPPRPPRAVLDLAAKLALGFTTMDANLRLREDDGPAAARPASTAYDQSGLAVAASWRDHLDPDSVSKTLESEELKLTPEALASVLSDPDGFTPIHLMAAERLSGFDYLRDLVAGQNRPADGRRELTADHTPDWDGLPKSSQAVTIAHGHILQFRQTWKADGYSLGDLLYSLPLAPCQKKEIVIVDWDRRESAIRSESRRFDERLDARLAHDRGISEIVKSVLTEGIRGGSSSNVWAAGGGFGLGIPIGSGFLGIGAGGGAGGASSEAWQDASRTLTASSLQQLRERIHQSASALRSQRISVVQSVRQGETHQVQSEVVANHNHCHAITVEYFEVLQHFQVHHRIAGVRECLFIPLLMSEFNDSKVLRWRDQLEPYLLKRDLVAGFDAIERIQLGYADQDIPAGRYADQPMRSLQGELRVRLSIARPRDPVEDEALEDYFSGVWSFFGRELAETLYNSYLKNQEEKDRRFQQDVAPRIARAFADSLTARFKMVNDTFRGAALDFTMTGRYREGRVHLLRLRSTSGTLPFARAWIKGVEIAASFELPAGSRVIVEFASLKYTADSHSERLFHGSRRSDLKVDDPLFLNATRFTGFERRNPRQEDIAKRRQLLKHLNENLEHYHRITWWTMDASRRFMLLDGFEAPFTDGRSVASVVENRIVAIVGNCLVMPVASGYRLDPRYRETVTEAPENGAERRPSLLDLYTPLVPPKPLVLHLPTKGVYAEAVMGDCNSCEEIDDTRFWRWEQEPCPGEPTPIAPVSTESLRTPAPTLTPQDLPAPIVNLQNAPAAPAPTGLGAALGALGNAEAFRDITGLTQNQLNAIAALQSSLKTAESFGKSAAGFVKSRETQRGLPRTLDAIKTAQAKKLITDEDAQDLTAKAFESALGLPSGEASKKPVQNEKVKKMLGAANQAPKSMTTITDQVGGRTQTLTIERDDTGTPKIDFHVQGRVRPLKQPNDMACWATVATILFSWKEDTEATIEDILTVAGQEFLDLFRAEEGLTSSDKPPFLERLGLVAEPPQSFGVAGFEQLLRAHGPLWITADEDPGANFSVHARVLIGLRGDGTPEGTMASFLDTAQNRPSPDVETVAALQEKLTQLAEGDLALNGTFRAQIVHYPDTVAETEASTPPI